MRLSTRRALKAAFPLFTTSSRRWKRLAACGAAISSRALAPRNSPRLALKSLPVSAAAEEFKYYVWIDEQGIVHAEEEAPKGVDYEVRIIEDVNANVVPAEDFRLGDIPVDYGETTGDGAGQSASGAEPQAGEPGEAAGAAAADTRN